MPVHCIFFVPGQLHFCQALEAKQTTRLTEATQELLEARYCWTGGFISCPVFRCLEQEPTREPDTLESQATG